MEDGPDRRQSAGDFGAYGDRSRLHAVKVAFGVLARGLKLRNFAGIVRRHVLRIA